MPAGRYDITVEAGATYKRRFIFYPAGQDQPPRDWVAEGWTARMHVRKARVSESVAPGAAAVQITDTPTTGDRIDLDSTGGLTVTITDETTDTLRDFGQGFYDIEVERAGDVDRFLEGQLKVRPGVTV